MSRRLLISKLSIIKLSYNHFSRKSTHYEVLNLKPTCTFKDVRAAFVKLSKKFHPDVKGFNNSSPENGDDFIRLMEAYRVLSNRHSRILYDQNIGLDLKSPKIAFKNQYWYPGNNTQPNLSPYYGIHGIQKMSNTKVLGYVLLFTTVGIIIQFLGISNAIASRNKQLDENSKNIFLEYFLICNEAKINGNEIQIQRLENKFTRDINDA